MAKAFSDVDAIGTRSRSGSLQRIWSGAHVALPLRQRSGRNLRGLDRVLERIRVEESRRAVAVSACGYIRNSSFGPLAPGNTMSCGIVGDPVSFPGTKQSLARRGDLVVADRQISRGLFQHDLADIRGIGWNPAEPSGKLPRGSAAPWSRSRYRRRDSGIQTSMARHEGRKCRAPACRRIATGRRTAH